MFQALPFGLGLETGLGHQGLAVIIVNGSEHSTNTVSISYSYQVSGTSTHMVYYDTLLVNWCCCTASRPY